MSNSFFYENKFVYCRKNGVGELKECFLVI